MNPILRGCCFTAFLSTVLIATPSLAGDRPLEVLFVNMTPDALATKRSDECVKQIRHALGKDIDFQRTGETRLRKRVRKTNGEPFLDWPDATYERATSNPSWGIDTLVLVDCRPETNILNLAHSPANHGVTKIRMHSVNLTKTTTKWIGRAIRPRIWVGFSP